MKKYIFTGIITLISGFCIISPSTMISAAKSGLSLWATIVVPSLFPFIILADLIQKTALPFIFNKLLNPVMKPLFNLPGISSVALFLGMTGGYPIGAKVTVDMLKEKSITLNEANHLITFANNSGPLFILGAVGIGIYKNIKVGSLLLISHYFGAIITGLFFRVIFHKQKNAISSSQNKINFQIIRLSQIGSTLNESIKKSIDIILAIGGFIILFSIISELFQQFGLLFFLSKFIPSVFPNEAINALITGFLEVTNGVNKTATANIPLLLKLVLTSILISFGGMSIHFQTLSILSKTEINFRYYLAGKTFHAINSSLITLLLLHFSNFSRIVLQPVSKIAVYNSFELSKILNTLLIFTIFSISFKLVQIFCTKH